MIDSLARRKSWIMTVQESLSKVKFRQRFRLFTLIAENGSLRDRPKINQNWRRYALAVCQCRDWGHSVFGAFRPRRTTWAVRQQRTPHCTWARGMRTERMQVLHPVGDVDAKYVTPLIN